MSSKIFSCSSCELMLLLFWLLDLLVAQPLLVLLQPLLKLAATATASAACFTATSLSRLFSSQLLATTDPRLADLFVVFVVFVAKKRAGLSRQCQSIVVRCMR